MRTALAGWTAPDEQQERLRHAFLARLDEGPAAVRRSGRPSHLTASAVVLDAGCRAVLLVLHAKTGRWLQPGGHVEDGDASLAAAALREAVEETGIAGLELLDDRPVHLERHPAASDESLDVAWFDLGALPVQPGVDLATLVTAAVPRSARPGGAVSRADDGTSG